MRSFKELKIGQKGFDVAVDTYRLTAGFPSSKKFSLTQQATRAAVSIPSNIAEGSSRTSEKDYKRFIEVSLSSSFESEGQLLICKSSSFWRCRHDWHYFAENRGSAKYAHCFCK